MSWGVEGWNLVYRKEIDKDRRVLCLDCVGMIEMVVLQVSRPHFPQKVRKEKLRVRGDGVLQEKHSSVRRAMRRS